MVTNVSTPVDLIIFAYIDPTASGTLLQVLLGGTAAFYVIRQFIWSRITGLWRRPKKESQPD
jgi:hypothetical protein